MLFGSHKAAAQPLPTKLRILTFNVWGVPGVSDDRQARMLRIGPAVAELEPDLVLFQEAWTSEDATTLKRSLAQAGLWHQAGRAADGPLAYKSTGLLIASKLPLHNVKWIDYEAGRLPHTPYHLDWMGSKAAIIFTVESALGPLTIVTTHLQASYETGHYEAVRLSQTLELMNELRAPGGAAGPTIVAGDLNFEPRELGERLLRRGLGLRSAFEDVARDAVFVGDGKEVQLLIRDARKVLTQAVPLGDGVHALLSDHPGLLIDLEVAPNVRPYPAGDGVRTIVSEARQVLDAELELLDRQRLVAAAGSVVLGVVLWRTLRGRGRRRRWLFVLLLALLAGYGVYFAFGYGPAHQQAIERARDMLAG